jgi:hypothetical protein
MTKNRMRVFEFVVLFLSAGTLAAQEPFRLQEATIEQIQAALKSKRLTCRDSSSTDYWPGDPVLLRPLQVLFSLRINRSRPAESGKIELRVFAQRVPADRVVPDSSSRASTSILNMTPDIER